MKYNSIKVSNICRRIRNIFIRNKIINKSPTIISNNCNATFIYKDLGLKFNSPTINLFFSINDFIKFLENMEYYLSLELKNFKQHNNKYPVGELGDLKIHFMHYNTFDEAKEKWIDRCKRIDKNNMAIIMNEGKGSTYDLLKRFDNLDFKNKVILTHKPYLEFDSAYYIKGFENKESCDFLFNYKNIFGKRYYEEFDYIDFLNRIILKKD